MCLKKCCFCVDLRTGSLICGYIMLVLNVGALALSVALYSIFAVFGAHHTIFHVLYASFVILELLLTIVLLVGLHKNKPRSVLVYIILAAIFLLLEISLKIWIIVNDYSNYSILEWTPIIVHILSLFIFVYFLSVFASYRKKMFGEQDEENSKAYYV